MIFYILEGFPSKWLNLDKMNNYSHADTLRAPYLFYFLLHIFQLALPLPPLHVEPLQQFSFLPWPVPFIVLQATAQVHGRRVCVLQEPPLLFPLPVECWGLAVLLLWTACWLDSSTDQPSTLFSFQLNRKKRQGAQRAARSRELGRERVGESLEKTVMIKDKLQLDNKSMKARWQDTREWEKL